MQELDEGGKALCDLVHPLLSPLRECSRGLMAMLKKPMDHEICTAGTKVTDLFIIQRGECVVTRKM